MRVDDAADASRKLIPLANVELERTEVVRMPIDNLIEVHRELISAFAISENVLTAHQLLAA